MSSETQSIIICGTGIIGLSTAYYLSQLRPASSVTLLDSSTTLFSCASGRAAGFLAADWFGPATTSLGALSFRLHAELAASHDGHATWGYAPSIAFSLSSVGADANGARGEDWLREGASRALAAPAAAAGSLPSWLAPAQAEALSSGDTTAQVHVLPRRAAPLCAPH
jgi:glycine/D-amino acid oxidase-like deaminating enzyme